MERLHGNIEIDERCLGSLMGSRITAGIIFNRKLCRNAQVRCWTLPLSSSVDATFDRVTSCSLGCRLSDGSAALLVVLLQPQPGLASCAEITPHVF